MAARRGKNQATRNSGHATPPWVWLVLGLLIGLAVYFIVPGLGKKDGDGFFRPQPNPDAQPAPIDSADVESVVPDAPSGDTPATATTPGESAPKETQYDFYTLLPGKEVQMSDAELAASAREEDARKARAALNGQATTPVAAAPTTGTAPAQPTPINETEPARTTEAPRAADVAATPRPAATVASTDAGARYILQAGAFGASGDAEATKAKIAMLGLSARVESAQINGKTVYRVRMGPYGTASELAEAKQKLASGGLPAMAVKAQ
ncbi:SPOR domain-containing protein [Pseudoxanthomonas sp.]|jgi:Cell division protein|uniref:SPOR domain-containing protein n=1 Tax=Pseudoxanthomonas sp. TaxID=1871049 RepID=UPI002FE0D915